MTINDFQDFLHYDYGNMGIAIKKMITKGQKKNLTFYY